MVNVMANIDTKKIGKRIAAQRKKLKMTQEYVASQVGISVNYLSSIERGVKTPKIDIFINLIDYLGITPNEIFMDVAESLRDLKYSEIAGKMDDLTVSEHVIVMDVMESTIQSLVNNRGNPPSDK